MERLQDLWDHLDEDVSLQFNLRTNVGEYDSAAGGFPVPLFFPGTSIRGSVPIEFSNAAAVRIFPVPVENGQDTLAKFDVSRSATITVTLDTLGASPLRSNTIEGRVSEVILTNRAGTEIGRYEPIPSEGRQAAANLTPADAAIGLAEVTKAPIAGQSWDEVLTFLQDQAFVSGTGDNFSGQLFSFEDENFKRQRPLEQYQTLTLTYAQTQAAAELALRSSTRRTFGLNGPARPFGNLDCSTPDQIDQCGIMQFERIDGTLVLTDSISIFETTEARYDNLDLANMFGRDILHGMHNTETQVNFSESELGGSSGRASSANLYWAGDIATDPVPLFDLRAGFSETFSAPTMLWLVDGQNQRTIIVTRSEHQ
jgi:hypothetical protein